MKVVDLFFGMGHQDDGIAPGQSSPDSPEKGAYSLDKSQEAVPGSQDKAVFKAFIFMDRGHDNSLQNALSFYLPHGTILPK